MTRLTKAGMLMLTALWGRGVGAVDTPSSDVPAALQDLRWHMLDAGVNTLTFHAMDQIFNTRKVGRAGRCGSCPRRRRRWTSPIASAKKPCPPTPSSIAPIPMRC